MIKCLLVFLFMVFGYYSDAQQYFTTNGSRNKQPRDCGILVVDLNNGTLNGLNPVSSIENIKMKLPCFTSSIPENTDQNCGGGVFFANKNVDFYTALDCITIRTKFPGSFTYHKQNVQLIGATTPQVVQVFGRQPDLVRNNQKPGSKTVVFTMSYGLIALNMLFDHVMDLSICNQKKEDLRICQQ